MQPLILLLAGAGLLSTFALLLGFHDHCAPAVDTVPMPSATEWE